MDEPHAQNIVYCPELECVAKAMEVSRNSLRSLMKEKDFRLPM